MSHFDKQEFQWAQPFIEQGNVNYFGSNGDTLRTVIKSQIWNQSKWLRLHVPSINELTPAYHARMMTDYSFKTCNNPKTDWGLLWAYISKPISDDSVCIMISYLNLQKELFADTINISNIELHNRKIPESFFVDFSMQDHWDEVNEKTSHLMIQKLLWSKPLGLVYFKTADNTEYYRSDVFYDIPIDKSSPR